MSESIHFYTKKDGIDISDIIVKYFSIILLKYELIFFHFRFGSKCIELGLVIFIKRLYLLQAMPTNPRSDFTASKNILMCPAFKISLGYLRINNIINIMTTIFCNWLVMLFRSIIIITPNGCFLD